MKKFTLLFVMMFLTGINISLYAQSFVPIQVTGFNSGLIAFGSGTVDEVTTNGLDWDNPDGTNYYVAGFKDSIAGIGEYGLPVNGIINSISTTGVTYQLYYLSHTNNSLLLSDSGQQGTLAFQNPGAFARLAVCAASAGEPDHPTTFTAQVNFSDNSNTSYSFTVPDWFDSNYPQIVAIMGVGRIYRDDTYQDVVDEPKMFDCVINLNAADQLKVVTGITFTKTEVSFRSGIFAVCGVTAVGTPLAAAATAATSVANTTFNANWKPDSSATMYYIDVSTTMNFLDIVGIYNNYNAGNVTTLQITGLNPSTNYYYRVRGANSDGQGANSNIITVVTCPTKIFRQSTDTSTCEGFPVTLSVTGIGNNLSYQWYNLSNGEMSDYTDSLIYTNAGDTYYCIVTGSCGNATSDSILLTINNVDTTVSVLKATLTANASQATYQWINCSNGNSIITGQTSQSYTATANGDYAVIVTQNSCTDTSSCHKVTANGITENNFAASINMFPNPVSSELIIETNSNFPLKINLTNIVGESIYNSILNKKSIIDMKNFAAGIYLIKIYTDNEVLVKKIIRQ